MLFPKQEKYAGDGLLTRLFTVFGSVLTEAVEHLETCKITHYETPNKARGVYRIGIGFDNVLQEGNSLTCKHVLALKLNQITNSVNVKCETVTDSQITDLLNEQLNIVG